MEETGIITTNFTETLKTTVRKSLPPPGIFALTPTKYTVSLDNIV